MNKASCAIEKQVKICSCTRKKSTKLNIYRIYQDMSALLGSSPVVTPQATFSRRFFLDYTAITLSGGGGGRRRRENKISGGSGKMDTLLGKTRERGGGRWANNGGKGKFHFFRSSFSLGRILAPSSSQCKEGKKGLSHALHAHFTCMLEQKQCEMHS